MTIEELESLGFEEYYKHYYIKRFKWGAIVILGLIVWILVIMIHYQLIALA